MSLAIIPKEPYLHKSELPQVASRGAILSRGYFVIGFLSLAPAVISTIWRVACWRAWGSSPHTTMGRIGFVSGRKNSEVLLGTKEPLPGVSDFRALYHLQEGH